MTWGHCWLISMQQNPWYHVALVIFLTSTPVMLHEEHHYNFNVLQRLHLPCLVTLFFWQKKYSPKGRFTFLLNSILDSCYFIHIDNKEHVNGKDTIRLLMHQSYRVDVSWLPCHEHQTYTSAWALCTIPYTHSIEVGKQKNKHYIWTGF